MRIEKPKITRLHYGFVHLQAVVHILYLQLAAYFPETKIPVVYFVNIYYC